MLMNVVLWVKTLLNLMNWAVVIAIIVMSKTKTTIMLIVL